MHLDVDLERLAGTIAEGSRAETRWLPLRPAPATWVTVPSGATSDRRANQLARVALAATGSVARGRPRISRSSVKRYAVIDEAEGVGGSLIMRDVAPPHDRPSCLDADRGQVTQLVSRGGRLLPPSE